jgi:HEAT repeat protein
MDELVKLVSRKTGLSEEMSREAVEIVLSYLKEKLPDPIAGQIDSVLGGAGLAESAEDLVKGLGGILGKQ